MDRQRNLLFALFAVHIAKTNRQVVAEALACWRGNPRRDVATRLLAKEALSPEQCTTLLALVEAFIGANDENPEEAVVSYLGGHAPESVLRGTSAARTQMSGSARFPLPVFDADEDETQRLLADPAWRYVAVAELGHGTFGRVVRAYDRYLGRDVALKELLPCWNVEANHKLANPELSPVQIVQRFVREARIPSRLSHPGVVPIYDLGCMRDGSLFYAMRFVSGTTLGAALSESGSLRERMALLPHFLQVCNAIAYAHEHGVVHRDIKPSNVLVGPHGETLVVDWGVATIRGKRGAGSPDHIITAAEIEGEARFRTVMGTPHYMSFEQARGELARVDERSDVYSLGSVLYELLTGSPPFEGFGAMEILLRKPEQQPRSIFDLAPTAPWPLVAICERAMQSEPGARYANAGELARDLAKFMYQSWSGTGVGLWRVRHAGKEQTGTV
jgi:serine/threonine protein kinase